MTDRLKELDEMRDAERDRLARVALFMATRTHHRLVPASEVLNWIRSKDKRVSKYPKWGAPYNPRSRDADNTCYLSDHVRWIENIGDAGLRSCGFADEICTGIQHTGWYSDPYGDPDNTLRGIVCQLPARNGHPQYVVGYADPNNEGAAHIDFNIIEGCRGGLEGAPTDDELLTAARDADNMAEKYAETEKEYQTIEYAKNAADEKLNEAKEKHAALREYITKEREAIAELRSEAQNIIDEPWQLFV